MKFKDFVAFCLFKPKEEQQSFNELMDEYGWKVLARNDINSVHIIPVNDMGQHKPDNSCWCQPYLNDSDNWVHNSSDGRETYEEGRLLQ